MNSYNNCIIRYNDCIIRYNDCTIRYNDCSVRYNDCAYRYNDCTVCYNFTHLCYIKYPKSKECPALFAPKHSEFTCITGKTYRMSANFLLNAYINPAIPYIRVGRSDAEYRMMFICYGSFCRLF